MKKSLLLILILINFKICYSQYDACGYFDFENPYHGSWCFTLGAWFDTNSLTNQIWQIGQPQKAIFDSARSLPNAIVTKLNTFYPSNDTSSFILREAVTVQLVWPHSLYLSGNFKINSDTINDYGYIKFSCDNGVNWQKLLCYINSLNGFNSQDSIFTGNSNGWAHFTAFLGTAWCNGNLNSGDTVAYRFTFISDSIQTNKEGWMIDDIGLDFFGEGVQEVQNDNLISIYPNPTTNTINIEYPEGQSFKLSLFNLIGEQMIQKDLKETKETLDISALPAGMYIVKVSGVDWTVQKKLIKE